MKKLLSLLVCSQAFASSNDWPVYRHDVALSGVSPGKGNITEPEVKWEYHLGAPMVPLAIAGAAPAANVADLDGDGVPERFSLSGKTIEVTDLAGHRLWSFGVDGHDDALRRGITSFAKVSKDESVAAGLPPRGSSGPMNCTIT